jgi:hypothetical protein
MRYTILVLALSTLGFATQTTLAKAQENQQLTLVDTKLALHQNREVVCGNGNTTYVRAETRRYHVNICGNSEGPNLYVGSGKTGQAIVLPLKSYSNGKYVAVSGTIRYILTSSYLTVTQNGRTILKEKVISWR